MTDTLDNWLTEISDLLAKLYGVPGYVLVFLSCIAVGYILRIWRWFPNRAIPVVAILWGPLFNMLIADPLADRFSIRVWLVKNFLVGLLIGGGAFVFHNRVLKKLEDKLPFLKGWIVPDSDTGQFNKSDFTDGKPLILPKEIKP